MAKITISINDFEIVRSYEILPEDITPREWGHTSLTIKLAIREAFAKEATQDGLGKQGSTETSPNTPPK